MKIATIILGVLLLICGIYCLATPGLTFLSIGWVMGILLLLSGINATIAYFQQRKTGGKDIWDLVWGLLTVAISILLISNQLAQFMTDVALVYLFSFWVIASGATRIMVAVKLRKVATSSWIWILVLGILTVVLGIFSLLHPLLTAITLGWLIGAYIIMQGINLIGFGFAVEKA